MKFVVLMWLVTGVAVVGVDAAVAGPEVAAGQAQVADPVPVAGLPLVADPVPVAGLALVADPVPAAGLALVASRARMAGAVPADVASAQVVASAELTAFKKSIRAKYALKERAFANHDADTIVRQFYTPDV